MTRRIWDFGIRTQAWQSIKFLKISHNLWIFYLEEGGDAGGGPDGPVEVDIVWVVPARHPVLEVTLTPVVVVMMVMMLGIILDIRDISDLWVRLQWALSCRHLRHLFLKANCFCKSLEKPPECHYSHCHPHIMAAPSQVTGSNMH